MILTPISPNTLGNTLDRFASRLEDGSARSVLAAIRATSVERAAGATADRHRHEALVLARRVGMGVHSEHAACPFNWDGAAIDGGTEAYVVLHEVAHFVLAPPARRGLIDFGLGPGPDTRDRDAAERAAVLPVLAREEDEAAASLLGIVWEAMLDQPALASFLDQNWLEGLDRSGPRHFSDVAARLRRASLIDYATWLARDIRISAAA